MNEGVSVARLELEGAERFVRLRRDLGVSTFGLNAIVLQPGERGRIHAHEHQEEVYLVLEGTLTLVIEGEERELGPYDAARVAPAVRRQLVNGGNERLVVLAIGGATPHDGRDGRAWERWDEPGPGRPPAEVPIPPSMPR